MAWPPGVLPINRTDATPQQTTHAADHNGANQAINDTVTKVVAHDAQIANLTANAGLLLGELKPFALTVAITTDANGMSGINFPAGTFKAGSAAPIVWAFRMDNGGPNPAFWLDYMAHAASPTGFVVQASLRQGVAALANTGVICSYIAIGVRP